MEFLYNYILTPIAVFLVGYTLLRLMGKKAVAEMSSFDILVVIILGTAISEPIVTKQLGVASFYSVMVAIVYYLFSKATLRNNLKHKLTNSPTVLVRNGEIDEEGLKSVRLTIEDLLGEIRQKGFTDVNELSLVMLEQTGAISAIPKAEYRPIQTSDLNMVPKPTFIPIPIIIDGDIVEHNLKYINKDIHWLKQQLLAANLNLEKDIETISLATYNLKGTLDIDRKNVQKKGVYNYMPGNEN